jgi:hypothetical protein
VQADSRDLSVPEVSLVTNIRAQPAPEAPGFWGDFMGKCRWVMSTWTVQHNQYQFCREHVAHAAAGERI